MLKARLVLFSLVLATPLVALASKEYEQGGRWNACMRETTTSDGGIRLTNGCSEHLFITWRDPRSGMGAMDLLPGQSWDVGRRPVGGFAPCTNGFSPVDGQDRNWNGTGKYRCVRY